MKFYAHTKENAGPDEWQDLGAHLENVAIRAADFADSFGAGEWGRIAGLVHDVGKARPGFQKKLIDQLSTREDHKRVGARLLKELESPFGQILSYCVGGHHSGLPDGYGTAHGESLERLVQEADTLPNGVDNPLEGLVQPQLPFQPRTVFQCAFFTRMIFSALVDADFLDTELYMDEEKASHRFSGPVLTDLAAALNDRFARFGTPTTRINKLRAEILHHCRESAALDPGLFTMTVPTGGGKTLTSMAFALDHALRHEKRRVVYVIPYTSIIEQNAKVFRDIFPEGSVVEHHSTFSEEKIDRKGAEDSVGRPEVMRHRLACENWDAPVVVTTNVQFFESLFASSTSRCRKLHNLANSVIILDEAQLLPVKFLKPCLAALDELARNYGASVVLCTATQPALDKKDFESGLTGLREIAPDPERMHREFARTCLVNAGTKSLSDVADMIREREQVLCIVNTRSRAAELFGMVADEPGARHLSALMCPAHRSEILADIRIMLDNGKPCRVVSTQLVEAGVDVSFPEVIREMSGLDSITQAAGRCNREGEIPGLANVTVFQPEEGTVPAFALAAGNTESTLRAHGEDPFSPEAIRQYFGTTYWLRQDELDKENILKKLSDPGGTWQFREVASRFRLIDSIMVPVIIPKDEKAEKLVSTLHHAESRGGILRKLQQYTVQVYQFQFAALDKAGAIEHVDGVYAVLANTDFYDEKFGLTFPESAPEAGDFIFR